LGNYGWVSGLGVGGFGLGIYFVIGNGLLVGGFGLGIYFVIGNGLLVGGFGVNAHCLSININIILINRLSVGSRISVLGLVRCSRYIYTALDVVII
jgi:hypothetical protein